MRRYRAKCPRVASIARRYDRFFLLRARNTSWIEVTQATRGGAAGEQFATTNLSAVERRSDRRYRLAPCRRLATCPVGSFEPTARWMRVRDPTAGAVAASVNSAAILLTVLPCLLWLRLVLRRWLREPQTRLPARARAHNKPTDLLGDNL